MIKWDTSLEIAGHPIGKDSGAWSIGKGKPGEERLRRKKNQKHPVKRWMPGFVQPREKRTK